MSALKISNKDDQNNSDDKGVGTGAHAQRVIMAMRGVTDFHEGRLY